MKQILRLYSEVAKKGDQKLLRLAGTRNSNDRRWQLVIKSSVEAKFTYALWNNSNTIYTDWIKQNRRKGEFRL